MPAPTLPSTEWRVCAVHLEGEWLGWSLFVYVRSVCDGLKPGPWRLVKQATYKIPSNGQVRNDYWKDLIKAVARS